MNKQSIGTLYLIPVPISSENNSVVSSEVVASINTLTRFIVEEERSARRMLRKMGYERDFKEVKLFPYEFLQEDMKEILSDLAKGVSVGLMSEAGCPGIADPGSELVSMMHNKGIRVIPLSGPSSIFLALMASGFNGQSFSFHGYLPVNQKDREKAIVSIEAESKRLNRTQIFMEAPFRNNVMLDSICNVCSPLTRLCVASDISGTNERIISQPIGKWKQSKLPDYHKIPTVFLLYASNNRQ